MRFNKAFFLIFLCLSSCQSKKKTPEAVPFLNQSSSLNNGFTLKTISGPNVLSVTVNGANCLPNATVNVPCVSVKVCVPGSAIQCETISGLLLDTASFGLRVFKSAFKNSQVLEGLPAVMQGTSRLASCVTYGDGSHQWGPIHRADIVLGEEPSVNVPIQLLDATFAGNPICQDQVDISPETEGFHGILGVGFLQQDCPLCSVFQENDFYFACQNNSCNTTLVTLANQVTNPVSQLPVDHNGVILMLPQIPVGGAPSASGYLVLGIGTQENNIPGAVGVYFPDQSQNIQTLYQGQVYSAFLDSGTNGILLPESFSQDVYGWFSPPSAVNLSALNRSRLTGTQSNIFFSIGVPQILFNSGYRVFLELAAFAPFFDWGLPFFLGRNVYLGFAGKASILGQNQYWAF